jgi:hypothetical protein
MYQRYEYLKQQWILNNPNATPKQYQQAIRQITQRLGI